MLGSWKPLICLLLIAVLAAAAKPAVADPLADANAAEACCDFTAAVSLYRTLAEKGNVVAQKRLGYSAPASSAIGSKPRSGTAGPRRAATTAPQRRSASSDAIGFR